MRTRYTLTLLTVAALLVPATGHAGTAVNPEVQDAAGDVAWLPEGDLSFMDLRAAWFETLRDESGTVDALRLTIRTESPRPADKPLGLMASWWLQDGDLSCATDVHIADDTTKLGVIEWTAQAFVYSYCEGDPNVITLGPLTVVVLLDGREVEFASDGADYLVTVPLASFEGSRVDGMYKEGATLERTLITTFKVLPFAWVGVDYNEQARPFTIGS